jgi:hypothetical protein
VTVTVLWISALRSQAVFSSDGCEKSFIAATIVAILPTPSIAWSKAAGISATRKPRSISRATTAAADSTQSAAPGSLADSMSSTSRRRATSAKASFRNRTLSPTYWVGVLISCAMPDAS